tara:strand:+ start:291 stop:1088 length:798 start_codon:yes stop_codon:yes gene_type:complete
MRQDQAEYMFKTIQQMWPKWEPPPQEQRIWVKALRYVSRQAASAARDSLYDMCDRFNKPRIKALRECLGTAVTRLGLVAPPRECGYFNMVCVEVDEDGFGVPGLRYEYMYYLDDEAETDWISKGQAIAEQERKLRGGKWIWFGDINLAREKARELQGIHADKPDEGPEIQTEKDLGKLLQFKRCGSTEDGRPLYLKVTKGGRESRRITESERTQQVLELEESELLAIKAERTKAKPMQAVVQEVMADPGKDYDPNTEMQDDDIPF